MLTVIAVWFLISLIVSPIVGAHVAYGMGTYDRTS